MASQRLMLQTMRKRRIQPFMTFNRKFAQDDFKKSSKARFRPLPDITTIGNEPVNSFASFAVIRN